MNSGLLFYWFAWILWIIITFFMKKSKYRTLLACWLLLLIIGSSVNLSIDFLELSLSYLVIFSGAVILHANISGKFFHVFVSFTITIGYTAMLIWVNHLPIEHFFPPTLIISCFLFLLTVIMATGFWNRLACLFLGMTAGELLYTVIIANYSIPEVAGDKRFLDAVIVVAVSVVCYDFILGLMQKIVGRLRKSITRTTPLFRKQAQ
ncbi:YphA family membrane protein [Lentibacillus jeotgali]|uniref:YphA family membrane protein n=1 Tax=Lentibacillus jeotgali TaxID=558169 RepID=UPI0002628FC4|nr:hypothetical protein [Lentibacillus jeotgali]